MKKSGAVSSSVLGIIIFAAVFLLLNKAGCSSCASCSAGCIACNVYSCTADGVGGRGIIDEAEFPGVNMSCEGADNGSGSASVAPKEELYINDYAGAVDYSTKSLIKRYGEELKTKTGAELTVVIIDNTEALSDDALAKYAYKLFKDWGVGSKTDNNGVLLLINTASCSDYRGNAWCMIGSGLEKLLPASDVGEMIDTEVLPELDNGNVSRAVLGGYSALYQKLVNILGG